MLWASLIWNASDPALLYLSRLWTALLSAIYQPRDFSFMFPLSLRLLICRVGSLMVSIS